jgi:hypothetical protein
MFRLIIFAILAAILISGVYLLFGKPHPYVLIRLSAANAIESTAQFQHKTKLFFAVNEAEAVIPDVCHNFEFAADKGTTVDRYLKTGMMKFNPYGNQSAPFPPAELGSLDLSLSDVGLLVDHIDVCKPHEVTKTTGAYELSLGKPVVNVTGIRKDGDQAHVDFTWHFESLTKLGHMLPRVQALNEMEQNDGHLSPSQRADAPFWTGVAEFTKYDDGWRLVTLNLETGGWNYGPHWPDPYFNWNTFDENQNHY